MPDFAAGRPCLLERVLKSALDSCGMAAWQRMSISGLRARRVLVFIPFDHFWVHDYRGFLRPGAGVGGELFRHSILANDYRLVGGRFYIGGIGRDRIGFLTHHDGLPFWAY